MKRTTLLFCAAAAAAQQNASGDVDAGRLRFNLRCAGCHREDGLGGERVHALTRGPRKRLETDDAARGVISGEVSESGVPAFSIDETDVLATAGGIFSFCDESGAPVALDAETGALLWHFEMNTAWRPSPVTYAVNDRAYIAVAAGSNIVTFAVSGRTP